MHQTDPKDKDSDNDGLSDYKEGFDEIFNPETNDTGATNPNNNDTDGDGLLDGEEIYDYFTNPLTVDTDGDGMSDVLEFYWVLDPLVDVCEIFKTI